MNYQTAVLRITELGHQTHCVSDCVQPGLLRSRTAFAFINHCHMMSYTRGKEPELELQLLESHRHELIDEIYEYRRQFRVLLEQFDAFERELK